VNDDQAPLARHQALVQALLRQTRWPHEAGDMQLMSTHVSSILLVGQHAYKLKKPLKLPFLDFSTLAQRQVSCEAELAINRRTAPEIYLEVIAITGSPDAPEIGGNGPVLDWAVHMRRFDQQALFSSLAQRRLLTATHVDSLADTLARLHLDQPALAPAPDHLQQTRQWMLGNFDELQAMAANAPERQAVTQLRDWFMGQWQRHQNLMDRRSREGWLRDGHGDLHLANIAWMDGRATLFDALEFNAELRQIDVVRDLAFAFMDLQAHGLCGLAWRLVNAWADATGDHAGLVLLPLFAVERACVRAKVAWLSQTSHHGLFDSRHFALAQRLALAPRASGLFITMGLSGSGKSTVSQQLLQELGAVRLRSDVERKRLHGLAALDRTPTPQQLYSEEATRRTFLHLQHQAATLLAGGQCVLVDAAFLRHRERQSMQAVAQAQEAAFGVVHCLAPTAVLRQRLTHRAQSGHDASDATVSVLEQQLGFMEPLANGMPVHEVDTDCGPDELNRRCRQLANALGAPGFTSD